MITALKNFTSRQKSLGLVVLLFLASCDQESPPKMRVELAPETFLNVERRVHNGMLEGSVRTTATISWPDSWFEDHIGQIGDFDKTTRARLVTEQGHHLLLFLLFNENIYHRPVQGGSWVWWPARNSIYSPPVPSIAAFLRDWLTEAGRPPKDYTPFVEGKSEESITLKLSDGQVATFGSRTHWTLPYHFQAVDAPRNQVVFATSDILLPKHLIFSGPAHHFGGWEFDLNESRRQNTTAPNK